MTSWAWASMMRLRVPTVSGEISMVGSLFSADRTVSLMWPNAPLASCTVRQRGRVTTRWVQIPCLIRAPKAVIADFHMLGQVWRYFDGWLMPVVNALYLTLSVSFLFKNSRSIAHVHHHDIDWSRPATCRRNLFFLFVYVTQAGERLACLPSNKSSCYKRRRRLDAACNTHCVLSAQARHVNI